MAKEEVISLLEDQLVPHATEPEAKVFFLKNRADSCCTAATRHTFVQQHLAWLVHWLFGWLMLVVWMVDGGCLDALLVASAAFFHVLFYLAALLRWILYETYSEDTFRCSGKGRDMDLAHAPFCRLGRSRWLCSWRIDHLGPRLCWLSAC